MTTICNWGHSLGLRLPAHLAQAAGLKAGSKVAVRLLNNGTILVIPLAGAIAVSEGKALANPVRPQQW